VIYAIDHVNNIRPNWYNLHVFFRLTVFRRLGIQFTLDIAAQIYPTSNALIYADQPSRRVALPLNRWRGLSSDLPLLPIARMQARNIHGISKTTTTPTKNGSTTNRTQLAAKRAKTKSVIHLSLRDPLPGANCNIFVGEQRCWTLFSLHRCGPGMPFLPTA
jgi:hypothetical protein